MDVATLAAILLLLQLAAVVSADPPALFKQPLFTSSSSKATLQSTLKLPQDLELPGTPYVKPQLRTTAIPEAPAPTSFNLNFVYVDYDLLSTMPPKLKLTLPGVAAPVTVAHRPDVAAAPHVWVGELESAPGAYSVVSLVMSEATRTVTGNVHYIDKETNSMNSFLITPAVFGSSDGGDVSTSSADAEVATAAAGISSVGLQVVVRHQGMPKRPECYPKRKQATKARPALVQKPSVMTNANGHSAVMKPKRRTTTGYGPGKTAIKLKKQTSGNTTAAAAAAGVTAESSTGGPKRKLAEASSERKLLQGTAIKIKLLVVYTDAAAAGANGAQQLENNADSAIAIMNKAYADSNINVVTEKVAFRRVFYTEPKPGDNSAGDVLDAVTQGDIANVFAWRDELGADLVTLYNNDNTVCGIGWMPGSAPGGTVNDPTTGFTAVMRGCWYSRTLAHEIGHNMGCNHDHDTDWQPGNFYPEYAHGYRSCQSGNTYATIMSYGDCGSTTAPAIFRFSSSTLRTDNGSPLGDATTADCSRKIRESAAAVAAYRPDGPVTTKCKATEKQCTDSKGAFKCLPDASMCCAAPTYQDDCPFAQKCDASTNKCVDLCSNGQKWCASANKCIPTDSCCPGNVNDCPSPYRCPEAGKDCVCDGTAADCGCPAGTVECGSGCIQEGTCCSFPDSCPEGQYCDEDGGSCFDLCEKGYKPCGGFCIQQETCCPSNPDDCPDPFYCAEWKLDGDGVPLYTTACACSLDDYDVNACCDSGYKACEGRCIPEENCCTWPVTCGYDSYCPESGSVCQPLCNDGATYCEGWCYWPEEGAYPPLCCKANPDWKSQCPAPFTNCPGNGMYCECPRGRKACGTTTCYNPKTNCCFRDDCNIARNQLCLLPRGQQVGKCTACKSGTKACPSSYTCIANKDYNSKCRRK